VSKKLYFFNAGLPRSGNTVLSAILNQNPDIQSSANSLLCDHLFNTALLYQSEKFRNFPDSKSLHNLLASSFDAYYADWNYKYIIDRAPWGTPVNLSILRSIFGDGLKILCPVRDIVEIIASFIRLDPSRLRQEFQQEILADRRFSLSYKDEKEVFCELISGPKSQLDVSLFSLHNLLLPENSKFLHIIEYKDFIEDPLTTLKGIYAFLDIPYFEHDIENISSFKANNIEYNDSTVADNLHTIRDSLSSPEYYVTEVLPPYLISRYRHLEFWRK
jgi:sulfotransferase